MGCNPTPLLKSDPHASLHGLAKVVVLPGLHGVVGEHCHGAINA